MKQQLGMLFLCGLFLSGIGNGVMSFVPLYALSLGATSGGAGVVVACAYVALALGMMVASRLASMAQSRKWVIVGPGMVCGPLFWVIGQTNTIWQLAALMAVLWFFGGVGTVLIEVSISLAAAREQRGRIFGMMFLSRPLGALVGAAALGASVEQFGYSAAFGFTSIAAMTWPLAAAVGLRDIRETVVAPSESDAVSPAGSSFPPTFHLLLLTTLLASITIFIGQLGTALSMQARGFTPSAISNTIAIGALATLPVLPLLSTLSDRLGRKRVTIIIYALAVGGMALLAVAEQAWHFWLAAALLTIANYTGNAIATAFASDLLPQAMLTRGLPRVSIAIFAAAMLGSAGTGYLMLWLGERSLYTLGAGLALSAIVLASWIGRKRRQLATPWADGKTQPVDVYGEA